MKKNKKQSNIDFRFMSFFFKVRDVFHPPIEKIRKANIRQGDIVLDYGCGSGSYTIAAAEEVKPNGRIFAADIHPLALKKVSKKSEKSGYNNIETIQTDCATGLDNESIDVVICFDVIHDIPNKYNILKEFHRVLKPSSTLSFDDHHLKENEIIDFITSEGLFKLSEKKDKQFNFIKA
ncbi:MAG: class I SAM-dependent methyltransferase [Promethearchaeota archaeon]